MSKTAIRLTVCFTSNDNIFETLTLAALLSALVLFPKLGQYVGSDGFYHARQDRFARPQEPAVGVSWIVEVYPHLENGIGTDP